MNAAYARLQKLLAVIGDRSRFELFVLLAERERHVSDLARAVGLSQSCTTRHLQALTRAGVVRAEREGKRVRMRLRLERTEVAGLLAWARREALAVATAPATAAAPAEGDGAYDALPQRPEPAKRARRPRAAGSAAHANAISGTSTLNESAPAAPQRSRELEDFLL